MIRGNSAAKLLLVLVLGVSLLAAACGGTTIYPVVITLTPKTAYVPASSSLQFNASVAGTPNSAVTWSVGNTVGGTSTLGFISSSGFYRAPLVVPSPNQVTITATSQQQDTAQATATVTVVSATSGARAIVVPSGQSISNINVLVSPLTPTLSIYAAGSCTGSTCTTSATGVEVAPGGSATVFIVGSGIVSGTVYSISGNPADVSVVQPTGSEFGETNNGTPSVSFGITVSASAAPGLRNIMVSNPATGELAVVVGGLLITPAGQ